MEQQSALEVTTGGDEAGTFGAEADHVGLDSVEDTLAQHDVASNHVGAGVKLHHDRSVRGLATGQ